MASMLIIERKGDGAQYAVFPKDFERNKDDLYKGFKPLRFEDGSDYEAPAKQDATKAADKPVAAPKAE